MSSRTPAGGGRAWRTRCTRRSLLVTVPSDSHQPAAAGSTTSASSAVPVRSMSCTTRVSRPLSRRDGAVLVRLGVGRVLADHVEGRHLAALHGLEHLGEVPAALRRDRHSPDALELGPQLVVLHVLEAGQTVGQGAHVAAALDVVLPAQRVRRPEP